MTTGIRMLMISFLVIAAALTAAVGTIGATQAAGIAALAQACPAGMGWQVCSS
jgi:hypothetical protein